MQVGYSRFLESTYATYLLFLFVSHVTALKEFEINKPELLSLENNQASDVCTNETKKTDAESDLHWENRDEFSMDNYVDSYEMCPDWASVGECHTNPDFMLTFCTKSCNSCPKEMLVRETAVESMLHEKLCIDWSDECMMRAAGGECEANPDYMLYFCKKSCNACQCETCFDEDNRCAAWAEAGQCDENPDYMQYYCRRSCGICLEYTMGVDQVVGDDATGAILDVIHASREYFINEVMVKPEFVKVRDSCKNKHEYCSFWAASGECETSADYMHVNCALACQTCHLLDINVRCPIDEDNLTDALHPGDLNKMFLKFSDSSKESEFTKYGPVVHSRPLLDLNEDEPKDIITGPWVVTFESFLTEEECDRLVELAEKQGFERSKVDTLKRSDGFYESDVTEDRTSKDMWCTGECYEESQRVTERIVNVTGIPEQNMEMFQMLKYDIGEYYLEHHDFNAYHYEGPRVLTFLIYLSDVEEGGGTRFPQLNNLTIMPKKGKAVLWANVIDSDPHVREELTYHEAMPVLKGTKYSANVWIHMHDFKGPHMLGCTG